MRPVKILVSNTRDMLEIEWDDGSVRRLEAAVLRAHCRSSRATIVALEGQPMATDIRITRTEPVGIYGINIGFSDGEERGIYPWPLLRSLSE